MFQARILKDKSNPNSAEAIAHSVGKLGTKDKDFEKLETIAVGRALATLGYMASGEIASSEEMEEFMDYQQEKKFEQVEIMKLEVDSITKIDELREYYKNHRGFGVEFDAYVTAKSKQLKGENI